MDLREVPRAPFRRHPWEVARANFFCSTIASAGLASGRPVRVLDVGSGDGYFAGELLERLPPGSTVTCVDMHYTTEDLEAEARRGIKRATSAPAGEEFDLLLLLDVIEHVPDDRAFLDELKKSLAPGAHVLVSVPAYQALFTEHDVKLGHYRRYTPKQCKEVLEASGFRVVRSGGLFHSLLVPRALSKIKEAVTFPRSNDDGPVTDAGAWTGGAALTRVVGAALAIDNRVSHALAARGVGAPGLSFWALCAA